MKISPNGNMTTAHPEVDTIRITYQQGITAGSSMEERIC
ncbi:cytidine deaminase-like fold-containing protein [Rahnella perminowiae]